MAKLTVFRSKTSKLTHFFVQDTSKTNGAGLAGLVFNSAGLVAYYLREGDASVTTITLSAGVLGTWSSGGFVEVDSVKMPGMYELGVPNAALASGESVKFYLQGATNMAPSVAELDMTATNNQDAVRAGLTALPNANAGAAGGLPTATNASGQVVASSVVAAVTAGTVSDKTGYALTAGEHTSIGTTDVVAGLNAQGYSTARAGYMDVLNGLVAAIWAAGSRTLTSFGFTVATASDANVTGIKAKTDQLTFTGANVNATSQASAAVDTGTAQAGAASTITLRAGASSVDGLYGSARIDITAGTGVGQSRTITGYVGATKVATIDSAWTVAPDATSVYSVVFSHQPGVGSGGQVLVPYLPASATVTAYAAGPAVTISNLAPVVNILVERGSSDPISFIAKDSSGNLVNLAGTTILMLVKDSPTDTDTAARLVLSNVTAGGITVTNAAAGAFTATLSPTALSDVTAFPDFPPKYYAVKVFAGATQSIVVAGRITVQTEAVRSTVAPT